VLNLNLKKKHFGFKPHSLVPDNNENLRSI